MKSLSRVQLLMTPWTAAYQALLSMGFSRKDYWSGVSLPSPEVGLGDMNWERTDTYTLPYVKQRASGKLLYSPKSSARCSVMDDLEEWDGGGLGGRLKREGIYVILQLIHIVV